MKRIVIFVHRFIPEPGGIEVTASVLAQGFTERHGADVLVVTRNEAPSGFDAQLPYRVLRNPSPRELLAAVRGADVVFHNNPLMQWYWAQVVHPRPWVVTMRSWIRVPGEPVPFWRRPILPLKKALIKQATVLAANSHAMNAEMDGAGTVVHNSYRSEIFHVDVPIEERDRHRVSYVGRLSDVKGIDVLIAALGSLRRSGLRLHLDIIGSGDQDQVLRDQVEREGVTDQVTFHGNLEGLAVNDILNRAAIHAVPSVWAEAFGTVTLEGQAAGCAVLASDIGGIPEALGGTGRLVPAGDVPAWTQALRELATDDDAFAAAHRGRQENVDAHRTEIMVDRYWELVEEAAARGR